MSDLRRQADSRWPEAARRPCIHAALRPGARDLATPESWGNLISTRAARKPCPRAQSPSSTRSASRTPVFSATFCARMAKRNVKAMVTDGVVRDMVGVLSTVADLVRWRRRAFVGDGPDVRELGANRSAAAASLFFPTTSSSPTTMARC